MTDEQEILKLALELAEAEARERVLREALERIAEFNWGWASAAGSQEKIPGQWAKIALAALSAHKEGGK